MKHIFTQRMAVTLFSAVMILSWYSSLAANHSVKLTKGFANPKASQSMVLPISFSNTDSTAIFTQSLHLPGLQSFLEKDANGQYKQLNVLIHSVPFPEDGSVIHSGHAVLQVSKSDVKNNGITAYFYFHELKIEGSKAYVDYTYNYDITATTPKSQMIHVELQKTGADWTITNTKMEAR